MYMYMRTTLICNSKRLMKQHICECVHKYFSTSLHMRMRMYVNTPGIFTYMHTFARCLSAP